MDFVVKRYETIHLDINETRDTVSLTDLPDVDSSIMTGATPLKTGEARVLLGVGVLVYGSPAGDSDGYIRESDTAASQILFRIRGVNNTYGYDGPYPPGSRMSAKGGDMAFEIGNMTDGEIKLTLDTAIVDVGT